METMLMAPAVQEASLASLLGSLRGEIVDARLGYPDVLHVEVRDSNGGCWSLVTQDAAWKPIDPAGLIGQRLEGAVVGHRGELRCELSGGSALVIHPADPASGDNPPHWEVVAPSGVALEFGPGARWQISSADVPVSG
jgi:hypothetical protein